MVNHWNRQVFLYLSSIVKLLRGRIEHNSRKLRVLVLVDFKGR